MALITLDNLITEFKVYVRPEFWPMNPVRQLSSDILTRWAQQAAMRINERRGVTTRKETTITTTEGVQEYALPSTAVRVIEIRRQRYAPNTGARVLGVPVSDPIGGLLSPLGRGVLSGSMDVIRRQQLAHVHRENEYELIGGMLRFTFPTVDSESITVVYMAVDTDFTALDKDRFFDLVLMYLRIQALDSGLQRRHGTPIVDGDSLTEETQIAVLRQMRDLEGRFNATVEGLGPEL